MPEKVGVRRCVQVEPMYQQIRRTELLVQDLIRLVAKAHERITQLEAQVTELTDKARQS
jgi:hypothetical protein